MEKDGNTKSERALVVVDRGGLNLRGNIEFKNSETTLAYGSAIDNAGGTVNHRYAGNFWVHDNISVGKGAICNRAYAGSSPTLVLYSTNTIENNTSTAGDGGGIWNEGLVDSQAGPTTIQNNRCEAGSGGGIYSSGASARINTTSTLTVSNNYAYAAGGGIYSYGNATDGITMGSGILNVTGNDTTYQMNNCDGGGLCIYNGTANFAGNTLNINNNNASLGGGMIILGGSTVNIHCTTTTFSGNKAYRSNFGGGAIFHGGSSKTQIYGGTTNFISNTAPSNKGYVIYSSTSDDSAELCIGCYRSTHTGGSASSCFTKSGTITCSPECDISDYDVYLATTTGYLIYPSEVDDVMSIDWVSGGHRTTLYSH